MIWRKSIQYLWSLFSKNFKIDIDLGVELLGKNCCCFLINCTFLPIIEHLFSLSLVCVGKLILQQHERGGDPLRVGKESTVGVSQWMKPGLPLILIPYAAIFHAKGNSLWLNAQSTHFIRFMGKKPRGRWLQCMRCDC